MSKFSFGKMCCAVLCTASMGINASAQDPANPSPVPRPEGRAPQQPAGQNAGHHQNAAQHQSLLASCLVHDNQAEVALSRMAQEKSQSEAVKKFAGMIVEDHQKFLGKLQKFAPNAGQLSQNQSGTSGLSGNNLRNADGNQGVQNRSNQVNQDQDNRNNATATQPNPGQSNDIGLNVAKLQQELAQQCLSDAQEKLAQSDGDEFDKCYVGMQIAMHAGMKSKLTVFSRHASGEFKQLIDQGLQTTGEHLEKAESIMEELAENSGSSRSERRTTGRSTEKPENR